MNYFEIENLKCSYNQKDIVLEIEHLDIPRGCVAFIVGESGCGKSTILETLGLMNNTLYQPDTITKFLFKPDESHDIDCRYIWKSSNKVLSNIRKQYFSFIFQQTNLMRNFTIKQNACLPQLIKEHQSDKKNYEELLETVGLEQIIQERKTKVGELSGGQQQRLAFVRAFMPEFQILFGDEPTGNLDPHNADKLMRLTADEIHKSQTKTAIIVSHTPELYNKYADIIIEIHKKMRDNGKSYGFIDRKSVIINHPRHEIH